MTITCKLVRGVALGILLAAPASICGKDSFAVSAQPAATLSIARTHRAPAEVISLNRSAVAAETGGIVRAVHADAGDRVEAGTKLIELDTTDLELAEKRIRADIASTRARIEQAKLRLSRAKNLSQGRFVSADELLSRETELSVLNAEIRRQQLQLDSARRDIEKGDINAPFKGVVVERQAQLGNFMRRGDSAVTLVDTERFELEVRVPEPWALRLRPGIGGKFVSGELNWPVTLNRVFPLVEQGERIVRARFRFSRDAPMVGSSGELRWHSPEKLLPPSLLVRRDGKLGGFIIRQGLAHFVTLPGAVEGRPATHPLDDKALIIVDGRERLQDGDRVEPIDQ